MIFELTLITSESTGKDGKVSVFRNDIAQANNLLQLVTQFNFIVLNLQRLLHEEEMLKLRMNNDDIPF